MGQHNETRDDPEPGRPRWRTRPAGQARWQPPGRALTLMALLVVGVLIVTGSQQGSYFYRAPEPDPFSLDDLADAEPSPGVSLTVGPEQRPTPTSTPTPTQSPPRTPAPKHTPARPQPRPAPASADCHVAFSRTSSWEQGHTVTVVLHNRGGRALRGWTVEWRFRGDQRITNLWNGSHQQSDRTVLVRDAGWNAAVDAGASVQFGFQATVAPPAADPDRFAVNGVTCG